jgi:large subunit ribosomal protein L19
MDAIRAIEAEQLKKEPGDFRIGDTVRVHFKIVEGKTERVQVFEGIVIARKRSGVAETFTVRKISYGVGVERVFPLHSPKIVKVVRVREGRVRRSKLYYLRGRTGKAAKVTQLIRKKRVPVVPEEGTAETDAAADPAGQPQQ